MYQTEICLFEEQNMILETLQAFKKLAEVTDTAVSVKFKPSVIIKRTPIIITSNYAFDTLAPPEEKEAFEQRYIKYKFPNPAFFLVKSKLKLNPAVWEILFENYVGKLQIYHNISSDEETELIKVMDMIENKNNSDNIDTDAVDSNNELNPPLRQEESSHSTELSDLYKTCMFNQFFFDFSI